MQSQVHDDCGRVGQQHMSDDFGGGGDDGGATDFGGGGGGFGGDSVTEVTTSSWGRSIVGAILASLIGIALVVASVWLLWWNEGRAVEASRALASGARDVVEIAADRVDPASQGKLVHVTGATETSAPARDTDLGGVGAGSDLLRLRRTVSMYQWVEEKESHTEKNLGGSSTTHTTYSYHREWSESAVDSSRFREPSGHHNPPMPLRSTTIDATDVRLGAFRVSRDVLDALSAFTPLDPQSPSLPDDYRQEGETLYRGQDPARPAIGDIRIRYGAVKAQTVSVVAAQEAPGNLVQFRAANGYTIALAEPGVVPAAALFKEQAHKESILTWVLRPVGFVLMLFGLCLMAAPISAVLNVIPVLGDIAGIGVFSLALVLSVPLTLLVIALAWIAHRPLLGAGLIVAGGVLGYLLRRRQRRRRPAVAAAPPRPQQPPPPPPPQPTFLPPGILPR